MRAGNCKSPSGPCQKQLLAAVGVDDELGAVVHESGEEFLVRGGDFVDWDGFFTEGASACAFIGLVIHPNKWWWQDLTRIGSFWIKRQQP